MDFLLKPIEINRLKQAVSKVKREFDVDDLSRRLDLMRRGLNGERHNILTVSDRNGHYLIPFHEIIAIEADQAYCTIHTKNKKFVISKNLKHFEI